VVKAINHLAHEVAKVIPRRLTCAAPVLANGRERR
jgi:hypothetical protein